MSELPRMRAGLVGCGPRAIGHFRALETIENLECVGACDIDKERREVFAAETGAKTFEKLEDLLAESPDIVGIVTNVETHVPLGCAAIEAGAAVVVEKPLGPSTAEAKKITDLAREKGVPAAVSFQLHYDGFCRKMKELCSSVEPLLVHHSRHSGLMQPQFLRPGKFTGVFDYLVHEIDLVRWWTRQEVVGVTARIGCGTYGDHEAPDLAVLHLDLDGDERAAATLVGSMAGPPLARIVQIAGRNGAIQAHFGKTLLLGHGPGTPTEEVPIPETKENMTAALYRDMTRAIQGLPVPDMPTLQDGFAAVAVVEAAFQSHEQGARIEIHAGCG